MSSSIPSYLNEDFFMAALKHGRRDFSLRVVSSQLTDITRGGENYCSNIYRAIVRVKRTDKEFEQKAEEQKLIVKVMPVEKQAVLRRLQIFCKETIFYQDIRPKVEALMMLMTEKWRCGARHLFSTHQPEESIVFEDLCAEGFKQKCRQTGLDASHARIVLEKLAQYHAATMYLAEKEPQLLKHRYPFGLLNAESIKTPNFKALFGMQLLKLADLLVQLDEFKDIGCKLFKYFEEFEERVLEAVYPLEGNLNVLNHGDLWMNNIFFKYDDSERLKETQFIDFQLCFFGSLGFDVNYFINTSLKLSVLRDQREELISGYCDTLLKCCSKLYSIADFAPLPSREQILSEIRSREAYGFFVSFAFFPLMSMVSLDSSNNSLENLQKADFAREKINLMFTGNPRTMETLKYSVKRFDEMGVFD